MCCSDIGVDNEKEWKFNKSRTRWKITGREFLLTPEHPVPILASLPERDLPKKSCLFFF